MDIVRNSLEGLLRQIVAWEIQAGAVRKDVASVDDLRQQVDVDAHVAYAAREAGYVSVSAAERADVLAKLDVWLRAGQPAWDFPPLPEDPPERGPEEWLNTVPPTGSLEESVREDARWERADEPPDPEDEED